MDIDIEIEVNGVEVEVPVTLPGHVIDDIVEAHVEDILDEAVDDEIGMRIRDGSLISDDDVDQCITEVRDLLMLVDTGKVMDEVELRSKLRTIEQILGG